VKRILAFAAVVELGTGVALMAEPAIVVRLLLGADLAGVGLAAGRCFGIALMALALACWPGRTGAESGRAAFRGMLVYNVLIALYLVFVGTTGPSKGPLLWPAVALHAVVALLLVSSKTSRREPRASDALVPPSRHSIPG
jgi:hypothetical protein